MIRLTHSPIQWEEILAKLRSPRCGAVVTFFGTSRNHHEGRAVRTLFYEAYEEMAKKKLEAIYRECLNQFEIENLAIVHRLGEVPIGEISLFVAASAPHRQAAFEAVMHTIDRIKEDVPIWKKEFFTSGESQWVE